MRTKAITTAMSDIAQVIKERDALKRKLDKCKKDNDALKEHIKILRSDNNRLKSELAKIEKALMFDREINQDVLKKPRKRAG